MESAVGKVERAIDKITGVYKIIPAKYTYLREIDKKHNGAIMFDHAVYSHVAEKNSQGLIVTGLTDQEARELEQEMGMKVGDLSPYNTKLPAKGSNDFSWATFYIKIPKEGLILDGSRSAKEKLMIKVLQAGSRVATSTSDLAVNPVLYELVMVSEENEAKITKDKGNVKKKAYAEFAKLSFSDMMDFLSVYDEGRYKVSKDATPDFIEAEVGKIVDSEPEKFLSTLESESYKTMVFLFKCVNNQLIYKQGTKYVLAAGGDLIGSSFLEAVKNLQHEDYQAIKISLLSKLEAR